MEPKHDYVTLYHGTTQAALAGILESGFVPNAQDAFVTTPSYDATRGFCYFSQRRDFAEGIAWWRESCTAGAIPSTAASWIPRPPANACKSPGVVIELRVPRCLFKAFTPDPNGGRGKGKDCTQWRYQGILSPADFIITDVQPQRV